MHSQKTARSLSLPAVFSFLLLLCTSAPSSDLTAEVTWSVDNPPDPEEIVLFEELASWIEDDLDAPLRHTIRDKAASFDLFRHYHEDQRHGQTLAQIPYGESIRKQAADRGVDALLIAAIVEVESRFDPGAISERGAVGLMQVLPTTAGTEGWEPLIDPETNLEAGTRYLSWLLDRYEGDLELALAAYNAGPANVRRYGGLPPFRETRQYVEKVLRAYVQLHREVWQESEIRDLLVG